MRPLFNAGAHDGRRDNASENALADRGNADEYDECCVAQGCRVRADDVHRAGVHAHAPSRREHARARGARLSAATRPQPSTGRPLRA